MLSLVTLVWRTEVHECLGRINNGGVIAGFKLQLHGTFEGCIDYAIGCCPAVTAINYPGEKLT